MFDILDNSKSYTRIHLYDIDSSSGGICAKDKDGRFDKGEDEANKL